MSYRMIEKARRLMCDKFSVLCTLAELNEKQLREIERGNGMNKQYEMVADFQTKMSQPVAEKPTEMRFARREQRFNYMAEELEEFIHAKTVVDQADAMIDLIYLAIGTMVELGVKPEPLFEIVHNANMSKLWPDGKPKLNPETGKVIKPPTFVRPEPLLEAEIERQIKEAE